MKVEEGPHIPEEPEWLPYRKVVAVGVAALLSFTGGVLWAWSILLREAGRTVPGADRIPAEAGDRQIGMVQQRLFDEVRPPETALAPVRERLRAYGWVDRARGVIHIPIERAIDLVLEGRVQPIAPETLAHDHAHGGHGGHQ